MEGKEKFAPINERSLDRKTGEQKERAGGDGGFGELPGVGLPSRNMSCLPGAKTFRMSNGLDNLQAEKYIHKMGMR